MLCGFYPKHLRQICQTMLGVVIVLNKKTLIILSCAFSTILAIYLNSLKLKIDTCPICFGDDLCQDFEQSVYLTKFSFVLFLIYQFSDKCTLSGYYKNTHVILKRVSDRKIKEAKDLVQKSLEKLNVKNEKWINCSENSVCRKQINEILEYSEQEFKNVILCPNALHSDKLILNHTNKTHYLSDDISKFLTHLHTSIEPILLKVIIQ